MISVEQYTKSMRDEWDEFVKNARNSTLLHLRGYMDYHSNRFKDASLIFRNSHGDIIGVFPACISRKDSTTVASHEGLTYGGMVLAPTAHAEYVEKMLDLATDYYSQALSARRLIIKPVPYIYNWMPSEEELYFIRRMGGQLTESHLSQTIDLTVPLCFNKSRRYNLSKAQRDNVSCSIAESEEEWREFHSLLSEVLISRHDVSPTHTADELWLLHQRFPEDIVLYVARKDKMLGGAVIYYSPLVAHSQYLAVSNEGRECGALDLAISYAITQSIERRMRYFDFGISTEYDGSLNHGLCFQKEAFGGRGVCYNSYKIML